jgi:hypothetical protein
MLTAAQDGTTIDQLAWRDFHEIADPELAERWIDGERPALEALARFGLLSWDGKVGNMSPTAEGPMLFRVLLSPVDIRCIINLLANDPFAVKHGFKKILADLGLREDGFRIKDAE